VSVLGDYLRSYAHHTSGAPAAAPLVAGEVPLPPEVRRARTRAGVGAIVNRRSITGLLHHPGTAPLVAVVVGAVLLALMVGVLLGSLLGGEVYP
jgi:hypothetical protein